MHTFVVLFLTAFLLLSPEGSALASDPSSTCYQPTSMTVSTRTCNTKGKCHVWIWVSATHQPGMKLCFQSGDTMHQLYPVKAYFLKDPTPAIERTCRPLVPSKTITIIADECFRTIDKTATDAIKKSGLKQQGTYTKCSTGGNAQLCASGAPLHTEQDCPNGLHTWEHTCPKTAECSKGVDVASYYCPEIKTYTVKSSLTYYACFYDFEQNVISLSNGSSKVLHMDTPYVVGDQPNPYTGWTFITDVTNQMLPKYTARPKPVSSEADCDDYCAMMKEGSYFRTQKTCSTPSADLCAPTRQVTWQQFDPSHNKGSVTLPHTAEDGSVLDIYGSYTTPNMVNPFTYRTNVITVELPPVDPAITSGCRTNLTDADVNVQKQTYPRPDLVIVRRVCDQVVVSLGGCVVQYSHFDGSAMYWTVENRGSSSQCTIYVVNAIANLETRIPVTPMAERSAAAKKLPAWAIAVITVAAVVVVVLIVMAVLCMCPRTRRALMTFFNCRQSQGYGSAMDLKHVSERD